MEHIRDTAAPTRYRGSENGMTIGGPNGRFLDRGGVTSG